MKRDYYVIFVVALYVILLHSFVTAGPFDVIDTGPPPAFPSPPSHFSLSGYSIVGIIGLVNYLFYLSSLIGGYLVLVKLMTVAPFIIGTLSLYYVIKVRGAKGWTLYLLPLIFGLNPYALHILEFGDAIGVLMGISFTPLVYHFGDKVATQPTKRSFLAFTGVIVISQFFFYQSFVYDAILLLPIILRSRSLKFLELAVCSLSIGFLSELSAEISAYLFAYAPPSIITEAHLRFEAISIVLLPLVGFALASLFLLSKRRSEEFLSLLGSGVIVLALWIFLSVHPFYPPLLGAIFALFTEFSAKVGEILMIILALTLSYIRDLPLRAFMLGLLLLAPIGTSVLPVEFFPMSQYEVPHSLYDVAHFLQGRTDGYVGVYYSGWYGDLNTKVSQEFAMSDIIPSSVEFTYIPNPVSLSKYGIQYLVTTQNMTDPGLRLVYYAPPYYVYLNQNFTSIAFSPSGNPLNFSLHNDRIVVTGNSSEAIVLIHYSPFWNGTTQNGSIPLFQTVLGFGDFISLPMNYGVGITVFTFAPILTATLWIDVVVNATLLALYAGQFIRKRSKTHQWNSQERKRKGS